MRTRLAAIGAAALVLLAVVVGCSKQSGSGGKIELEVASFKGGFGLDFFEYAAREYEKTHPDIQIKVWGNPRIWEQLRMRFNSGDVPDLCWPGWGMDTWALVADGLVMPMDRYLEGKAYDSDRKWKDTFVPALLERGKLDGKYYIMPFNNNVFGWWYNAKMFRDRGWQPPRTYDELLALCEKIKAAGIAPLTYQGKYPNYMIRGFLLPWAISEGGLQVYTDAQNLKPGAWKHPAFVKAATRMAELRDRGYFQKGAMGMDHTGSQMEFVLGRAAMIPCGTWLGSEMKNQIPEGFEMRYINPPVIAGGKGDPTAVSTGIETWIIPAQAKHPDEAADFFKFMTSLKMAREFVARKNTLMAVRGSDEGDLPPDLVDAAKCMREAKQIYGAEYSEWYRTMAKDIEAAVADLLNGAISPRQCCDRMEAAAEACRKDESVPKHTVM